MTPDRLNAYIIAVSGLAIAAALLSALVYFLANRAA